MHSYTIGPTPKPGLFQDLGSQIKAQATSQGALMKREKRYLSWKQVGPSPSNGQPTFIRLASAGPSDSNDLASCCKSVAEAFDAAAAVGMRTSWAMVFNYQCNRTAYFFYINYFPNQKNKHEK